MATADPHVAWRSLRFPNGTPLCAQQITLRVLYTLTCAFRINVRGHRSRTRPRINAPLRPRQHPAGQRHGPTFPATYAGLPRSGCPPFRARRAHPHAISRHFKHRRALSTGLRSVWR